MRYRILLYIYLVFVALSNSIVILVSTDSLLNPATLIFVIFHSLSLIAIIVDVIYFLKKKRVIKWIVPLFVLIYTIPQVVLFVVNPVISDIVTFSSYNIHHFKDLLLYLFAIIFAVFDIKTNRNQ